MGTLDIFGTIEQKNRFTGDKLTYCLPASHLPGSWSLGPAVAFAESLGSTSCRLSSHSTGRTHPHQLGIALKHTHTHKHTQINRQTLDRDRHLTDNIPVIIINHSNSCVCVCARVQLYVCVMCKGWKSMSLARRAKAWLDKQRNVERVNRMLASDR